MTLTYFGHSAFQLETGGTTILLDPFISGNPHAKDVVEAEDLNPHVILLTHAHGDHWGDTPEIATRSGATVIANYEIIQYLENRHGHDKGIGMNSGGSLSFDWGRVTQTWARHSSSFPDGTYGGNPGGFLIEADGACLYAMGDTSPFAEMAWISEENDIDLALMPIGDTFTMGLSGSLRAADLLKPKRIIPIHYNTFPPIEVDMDEWTRMMKARGHDTHIMTPGESLKM